MNAILSSARLLAVLALLPLGSAAAGSPEEPAAARADTARADTASSLSMMPLPTKVPVPGSELHRLRFPDGSVTVNDQCPVAKRPLNPKMPPVWVNGRPVGFC